MIKCVISFYFLMFSCFSFAKFEIGVGYKNSKIENTKSLDGIELSFGKKYFLYEMFGAKTSFEMGLTGFTEKYSFEENNINDFKFKFREYDYGINQRFLYQLQPNESIMFIPFIDLGFGYTHTKAKLTSIYDYSESREEDLFYYKYGLGLQFLMVDGVGGEIKYNISKNKDYDSKNVVLSFIYNI